MRTACVSSLLALVFAGCAQDIVLTRVASDGGEGVPYCLPRTVLEVQIDVAPVGTVKSDGLAPGYSVTLQVRPHLVADPTQRYLLQHAPHGAYTDDVKIKTSAQGLLESVTVSSDDRSAAVARGLADAFAAAVKLSAASAGIGGEPDAADQDLRKKLADKTVRRGLHRVVGTHRVMVALPDTVRGERWVPPSIFPFAAVEEWELGVTLTRVGGDRDRREESRRRGVQAGTVRGIVVRGVEPFIARVELTWRPNLIVENQAAADFVETLEREIGPYKDVEKVNVAEATKMLTELQSVYHFDETVARATGLVHVPDYAPLFIVPIERAAFVKTTATATLASGSLTGYDVNRPSTAEAVVRVPVDVANTLVAIPGQILQLKIDTTKAQTSLVTEEQKLRDAEAARLGVLQALETTAEQTLGAAASARAAYDAAVGTSDELTKAIAFRMAALQANQAAAAAGRPRPYPVGSLPDIR